jgi:hypothetical protein
MEDFEVGKRIASNSGLMSDFVRNGNVEVLWTKYVTNGNAEVLWTKYGKQCPGPRTVMNCWKMICTVDGLLHCRKRSVCVGSQRLGAPA